MGHTSIRKDVTSPSARRYQQGFLTDRYQRQRQGCLSFPVHFGKTRRTLRNQWLRWTRQLKNLTVPRSMLRGIAETKAVHFHIFADASNLACCAATIAVVEHEPDMVKGLLTSKSRISKCSTSITRLELISGHMTTNLVKNVCHALKR